MHPLVPSTHHAATIRRSIRRLGAALAAAGALVGAACEDSPTGPEQGYTIRIASGNDQFGGFNQWLESPLQVIVENATTGDPVQGVLVEWSIIDGAGAELGVPSSATTVTGIAGNTLRLGPSDTEYRVRARVSDQVGSAATFEATAVVPATLSSVAPASADAGDTIEIFGSGFAPNAHDNTVLVAGFRAEVIEAAANRLRAVVPACVPTRTAELRVNLGSVASNALTLDVTAASAAPVALDVGQVLYLADAAAASCLRLAPFPDAEYLLVLQSAATVGGIELPWRLTAATAQGLAAVAPRAPAPYADRLATRAGPWREQASPQDRLDLSLRELELTALSRGLRLPLASTSPAAAPPVEVGDRRDFWVFRSAGNYARITAEVRHVSEHAILYEDLDAPAGGFAAADFELFGAIFDDPIYETMVDVYGEPSDVDGNDRIIILFTPVVNRMTPPGVGNAFVAGFFFGIDLLADQPNGNDAEIFYTLVPDPDGEFGNIRTFEQMLQGVPPVMAHEFQHMIHFNQRVLLRDAGLETTWLSEGLAHTAEELIGDVYLERGDPDRAQRFRVQNFLRAELFLEGPSNASPLGPAVPLPVRGASWLLLEYLRSHFGGDAFLTELTEATGTGVANLTAITGVPWGELLSRWGVAMWADDEGVPGLDPIYSYPTLDLRAIYEDSGYPLIPLPLPWSDFTRTGALPSAASEYWILDAGTTTSGLHVAVAGRYAPFGAGDRPQLTVLRIQ